MKSVGIVAEYNPFHTGHAHHIEATRRIVGEDAGILCVMSGNWVQRGETAVTDKWTRAALALSGGADLVAELPTPWAISSAEGFARGAVSLLDAAGADYISFGSETGQLEPLRKAADSIEGEEYRQYLREGLDRGLSFAAARQGAVSLCAGEVSDCLSGPNNNLGVEYLRAITAIGSRMQPVTVLRQGPSHDDGTPRDGYCSASALRDLLLSGSFEAATPYLSAGGMDRLRAGGIFTLRRCERGVLAKLRTMSPDDFEALPDCGVELAARLSRAAREAASLEEIYGITKTRRYAHARVRRLVLWAFLGLSAADRPENLPYLRVLGMNGRGRILLRQMETQSRIPVLVKPAHVKQMGEEAGRLFSVESRCTDLFSLCGEKIFPGGREYTENPIVL